ncbi:MAG: sensor histidine kinase [Beijerinckiaceae bacterium]|nr:sensor histidine kinase [Beijerinckiaceae bacterium]
MTEALERTKTDMSLSSPRDTLSPRGKSAFSVLQLLAFLTLITLAPLLLFGAGALYWWDRTERLATLNRLSAQAESMAQAVDREIRGFREVAEGMAKTPALQEGRIDIFWRYAHDVAQKAGGHFALIDNTMQQLANTNLAPGSALPPARANAAIKRVLATGETVIANYEPRSVSGQTQFTILAPVKVDGVVRYVLGYAPAPNSIERVVRETYRPEGWLAAVMDRSGIIAARSVAHEEFFGRPGNADFVKRIAGQSGIIDSTDLEGRVSRTAWHTSQNGWKSIVWAPRDVLERPTRLALSALAAAGIFTVIVSIIASWFFSGLIRRSAAKLVDAAHKLGEGSVVAFQPTRMAEANAIGASLVEASHIIHRRESDLRASQAHTTLIMRELSHRSKNLLAMVQAMARQSARSSTNFADFTARFNERLQSLSMSHDLLVKTDWKSVPLRDLIIEQMRAFNDRQDERIVLAGEHVMLKPEAAQNLGMVFHELGSNAVKHGCLSVPDGAVHIDWSVESGDQPVFCLTWRETGGPAVSPPSTEGFGSTIIRKLIPTSFHGEASVLWDKEGLVWSLRAPLSFISWPQQAASANAKAV